MKICKHCRYASKIHDMVGRVKCRKEKTEKGENDLYEKWKRKN